MPIQVQGPDGQLLEFPDGTPRETMKAAMQKRYGAPKDSPSPPQQEVPPDPTEGMSGFDKFSAGVGKSFVDTFRGLKQAGTEAVDFIAGGGQATPTGIADRLVRGRDTNRYDNPVTRATGASLDRQQKEIDRAKALDAPLMDTGAGLGGNVVGTLAQLLGPGLIARGTTAGAALLPRTVAGNMAQGGIVGLLQPTGSGDSRAMNTAAGTALGTAGAALPIGGSKLLGILRRTGGGATLSGAERKAAETIAAESSGLQKLMTAQPSGIPGVQRTLAEETLDPGVARLERQMRGQTNIFQPIDTANNAARVRALEMFAGDEAKISAAKQARSAAANPLRRDAMKIEGVDTNRLISQIARLEKAQEGRPAVQQGLAQIRQLLTRPISDADRAKSAISPLQDFIANDRTSATNREAAKVAISQIKAGEWPTVSFITGGSGTAGVGASYDAARAALAQSRKALDKTATGHDKVAVIDNVRKTIGDMLSGKYGGDSSQALAGSRELMAIKNQMDRVLEKQAPQYNQYLEAFRQGSRPISRMQAGQELIAKGSGSVPDPSTGLRPLLPASFSKAAGDLDATAAGATGFRKAKAADILTSQDLAAIRAVQDDLERQAFRATAGSGGNSMTAERLALQDKLGARLAGKIPVVGGFVEALNGLGQTRVNDRLAYLLANPAEARRVLATLNKQDRSTLNKALFQLSARPAAAAPAIIGD